MIHNNDQIINVWDNLIKFNELNVLKMADWAVPSVTSWWFEQAVLDTTQMNKANLKFNFELIFIVLLHFSFFFHHALQVQTATRTQQWYQQAERWRLMSAQSATAHTRRAHGRLNVRPPAVRMSVRAARDQQDGSATLFTSDIRVGQQPTIHNF